MKHLALTVVAAFVLLLLRSSVSAQDASAVNIQSRRILSSTMTT